MAVQLWIRAWCMFCIQKRCFLLRNRTKWRGFWCAAVSSASTGWRRAHLFPVWVTSSSTVSWRVSRPIRRLVMFRWTLHCTLNTPHRLSLPSDIDFFSLTMVCSLLVLYLYFFVLFLLLSTAYCRTVFHRTSLLPYPSPSSAVVLTLTFTYRFLI